MLTNVSAEGVLLVENTKEGGNSVAGTYGGRYWRELESGKIWRERATRENMAGTSKAGKYGGK